MLMLLCVQIVQINNNESSWKKKEKKNYNETSKRYVNLSRKQKILIKKI
jgi:hypothetical protein